MEEVHSILESGFEDGKKLYFGDTIVVKRCEGRSGNSIVIENEHGTEEVIDRDECENGLITIQLDDLTALDLTTKNNRIAKRWSAWNVIDTQECVVVTVVWRPVSIGVDMTRMACAMCITDVARNCKHEIACVTESKYEARGGGGGEGSSDSEYGEVE